MSNEKSCASTSINWYPGHMAKTMRQIEDDIKLVDIVIELLDARIPISSQNPEIAGRIKNKKKIIILNKADLADEKINQKWVLYFEKQNIPAVLIDSNSGKGIEKFIKKIEEMMQEMLEEQAKRGRVGRKIRAMILGIPNVGKSSFINRISKRTTAEVGNKPGVTKKKQWIRINDKLELLDTPGILWPKLDDEEVAHNLASMTAIKEEVLDSEDIAIYIINKMLKDYKDNLITRYNITETEDIVAILDQIGKKIGAFRGGETDYDRVYLKVIKDLQDGYLGRVTFDNM